MVSRRSRATRSAALVVTAVMALLVAPGAAGATGAAGAAVAEAKAGPVPVGLPHGLKAGELVLGRSAEAGGVGSYNVINCTGSSHNPHPSLHNPGMVRGQGETTCSAPVPQIQVQPELYEWIPDYGWYLTSIGSTNTQLNSTTVRSSAETFCPSTPTYYVTMSYHKITFPAGYSPPSFSGYSNSAAISVVC